MAYKRMSRNDAYMNVANVEDDEDVIDLLEVARAILKHIKLIIGLTDTLVTCYIWCCWIFWNKVFDCA